MGILNVEPPREPRRQECRGLFLYGAGFYAREDVQAGILRGEHSDSTFCRECPIMTTCERLHRERAAEMFPDEVEEFIREVEKVKRRGGTEMMAAMTRMRAGNPDPYAKLAGANYSHGVEERRRRDGMPLARRGKVQPAG